MPLALLQRLLPKGQISALGKFMRLQGIEISRWHFSMAWSGAAAQFLVCAACGECRRCTQLGVGAWSDRWAVWLEETPRKARGLPK